MFTPEEYMYYNNHADRALSGTDMPMHSEFLDSVQYYHDGEDATYNNTTNIVIYNSNERGVADYYIDIFPDYISFEYSGLNGDREGREYYEFRTELFSTLSDEEWFQVGTVQDLSFIEETLLRKFIKLSLMARTNLNNREV